jgi:hypothetical protein
MIASSLRSSGSRTRCQGPRPAPARAATGLCRTATRCRIDAYAGEVGSYDEVHGGWQCGQTRALGKRTRHLLPGDSVELIPAPMTDAEFELYAKGQAHVRPERAFLLAMWEGGYVTVRDDIFVQWARSPLLGLPVFDCLTQPSWAGLWQAP